MNHNDLTIIKSGIKVLNAAMGFTIGRTASMAWLGFHNRDAQYALHLQTAFRIRSKNQILIANLDMFEPANSIENNPSFDWNTFNWDVQGLNRYDEWTNQFKKEYGESLWVRNVNVNSFGDLTIVMDQDIVIEVFANASTEECWRFFKRNAEEEHLVVTGQGVERC